MRSGSTPLHGRPLNDDGAIEFMHHSVASQNSTGPTTHEEARQFHEGFLSGATAYAAAVGHSTLKSDNPKLCEVFDAQGWRTIETFEKLAGQCEHAVKEGDWCEPCNRDMKDAQREQLEGFDCSAGFLGGMANRPTHPDEVAKPIRDEVKRIMTSGTAQPIQCACCEESSTNPGQFVKDGRWVCTEECRKNLPNVDSYADLAASGGIVDAP